MRERINKRIAKYDLKIAGGGRDGCFYFVRISTDKILDAESVYVSALSHLTLQQWEDEAKSAINDLEG